MSISKQGCDLRKLLQKWLTALKYVSQFCILFYPQNIDPLISGGALQHLNPLLTDPVATIQQSAAIAVGRLGNHAAVIADEMIALGMMNQIVKHLSHENKYFKKTASFVLRGIAKHSEKHARAIVSLGAVPGLVSSLNDFEPSVKESAVWALGYIARHSPELAQTVVDAGAVPLLISCYREPELALKRIAASTLSDIARHNEVLSKLVAEGGVLPQMVKDIDSTDVGLKRQVTSCLAHVAKHSVESAEGIVALDVLPRTILALKDLSEGVRKNSCILLRDICRHSENLSKLVVSSGGVAGLSEILNEARGVNRIPAIMSLGYIAAFSETLALAVIVTEAVTPLRNCLIDEPEDCVKGAAAWALGQIGRHSPEHARALAENEVLRRLLAVHLHDDSSEDLKNKSKKSIKAILSQLTVISQLEVMLTDSPPKILKNVVRQLTKILTNDISGRKQLVTSGSLQRVQKIQAEPDSKLAHAKNDLNTLYPAELVNFYSPQYPEELIKKLDALPAKPARASA